MARTFLLLTLLIPIISNASPPDSSSVATDYKRKAPQIVVSAGGALLVTAAITEVLKENINRIRPDKSENNSFPSRHSSWAFTASTVVSNELYKHSPWWALGTHAAASVVAFERVASKRHYASDVAAGAAIGIGSTEFVYWLSRKVFGGKSAWSESIFENDFRTSVSVFSSLILNIDNDYCAGYSTGLRLRVPLSRQWGLTTKLIETSTPVKSDENILILNSAGLCVGGTAHFPLPVDQLALEPTIEVGICKLLPMKGLVNKPWGTISCAECALSWRITRHFSCRGGIAYNLFTSSNATSGIDLSIASVAVF